MRELFFNRRPKNKRKRKIRSTLDDSAPRIPLVFPKLNDADAESLLLEHNQNTPYPYVLIDPLLTDEKMRGMQLEAKLNMRANLKETDLFKVYQTGDLANLDAGEMSQTIPNLLELRTALYSSSFRSFIEKIMGCRPLTDRIDCSMNAYGNAKCPISL